MSALRCPQCRAVYAEPARFCTRDGAVLEPKEEASDLPGTVLDELDRRQLKYGLCTLCIGGGMGIATIVERV